MLTFKKIDLILQLLALIFAIYILIIINTFNGIFYFYFGVGSIQFLSWLIHFFIPKIIGNWKLKKEREWYTYLILGIILSFPLTFFLEIISYVWSLFIMFGTPGMAIIYFYITLEELKNIRKQVN